MCIRDRHRQNPARILRIQTRMGGEPVFLHHIAAGLLGLLPVVSVAMFILSADETKLRLGRSGLEWCGRNWNPSLGSALACDREKRERKESLTPVWVKAMRLI